MNEHKRVGEECPRCCIGVLMDDYSGNAICASATETHGDNCGFSTEGMDDET